MENQVGKKKTQTHENQKKNKESFVSFHYAVIHPVLKCTNSKNLEGPQLAPDLQKKDGMENKAQCVSDFLLHTKHIKGKNLLFI